MIRDNELISVIIPMYNCEKYIRQCVESVLKQSYENLEVIVVDDGSTDDGGKLCDEIFAQNQRVKVFHKENGGISSARNYGIDRANGAYLFFLDSDDYLEDGGLEALYEAAKSNSADMAIGGYRRVEENGDLIKENVFPDEWVGKAHDEEFFWNTFKDNIIAYTGVFTKLYSRKLWENVCFPGGKIHEDDAVLHKIISQCERIAYVKNIISNYRKTENSIMQTKFGLKNLDKAEVLLDRIEYLHSKKLYNAELVTWRYGSQVILKACNELDMTDEQNKNKFDPLYRSYKELAVRVSKMSGSPGEKFKMFLFRKNIKLYCRLKSF